MLRIAVYAGFALLLAGDCFAQTSNDGLTIRWEVKNRFRLFTHEEDFRKHVDTHARNGSVLEVERALAKERTNGRGWAEPIIANDRLCFDRVLNTLPNDCTRDGKREVYLSSETHRIAVRLADGAMLASADCSWRFQNRLTRDQVTQAKCDQPVEHHAWYGRVTKVTVSATLPGGSVRTGQTDVQVRDILIAGIGDSIASGEGNPDVPVHLANESFCYFRLVGNQQYFRPSRAGYQLDRSCVVPTPTEQDWDPVTTMRRAWSQAAADWMSPACHRSLYGNQARTALAIAVEHPQIAVTYIPLGCTGAEVTEGLTASQPPREVHCRVRGSRRECTPIVPSQFSELRRYLRSAKAYRRDRKLDLILLTIGANDIGFSALVAHVMVTQERERSLLKLGKMILSPEQSEQKLTQNLPSRFQRLRRRLKVVTGPSLGGVIFVPYGVPTRDQNEDLCGSGPEGFDIHPAFSISGEELKKAADFVSDKFLPKLKAMASCEADGGCRDPAAERMVISDAHQPEFMRHGFCAQSASDPAFDRDCRADGSSFREPDGQSDRALTCLRDIRGFHPYASRARWIRTPNNSYFAAMTFPEGLPPALRHPNIHAGIWGVTSTVYGGALHPTAEGHAAIADGILPKAKCVLGLRPKEECDALLTQ